MDFYTGLLYLPKCEIHIHLRGTLSKELLNYLMNRYDREFISKRYKKESFERGFCIPKKYHEFLDNRTSQVSMIEEILTFTSFEEFIDAYRFTAMYINDIYDFELLVCNCIQYLECMNIVYAEVTVSVVEYMRGGLALTEIMEVLSRYKTYSCGRINWIVDLVWSSKGKEAYSLLERILQIDSDCFKGITLGGKEELNKIDDFVSVYDLARKNGMGLSVHAGETEEPEVLWEILNKLKPDRVGHGIKAIKSENVLQYIRKRKIPLEVCFSSNIYLGVTERHPIIELIKAGVNITINTDDPNFFNSNIVEEYMRIYKFGINKKDIFQIISNGFKYSFLTEDGKEAYLFELEKKIIEFWGKDK